MSGVVVDTSVWIDFLAPHQTASEEVQKMKILASRKDIFLCPVVYQEILQGIRDERQFSEVKYILGMFPMLQSDFPIVEDAAIALYRSIRRQGITIRKSNDCLIAAYSLVYDVPVLFRDRDFEAICEHSSVRRF